MAKIIITVETHAPRDGESIGVLIQGDQPDVHFDMAQMDVLKYILYAVVASTITEHPTLSNYAKSISVNVEK